MNEQDSDISSGAWKRVILCVGIALLAGAAVVGAIYRGWGEDPNRAAEQLIARVESLMTASEYEAAAGAIENFFIQHPDGPDLPRLWALKIVCHRKAGDSTRALLSVAGMAEKFQGRDRELCDAGDILAEHECYQDAAKAFELAAGGESSQRVRACYHAAACNYRLGRFAMAMKYIDAASALDPDDAKIAAALKRIEDARFVADQ